MLCLYQEDQGSMATKQQVTNPRNVNCGMSPCTPERLPPLKTSGKSVQLQEQWEISGRLDDKGIQLKVEKVPQNEDKNNQCSLYSLVDSSEAMQACLWEEPEHQDDNSAHLNETKSVKAEQLAFALEWMMTEEDNVRCSTDTVHNYQTQGAIYYSNLFSAHVPLSLHRFFRHVTIMWAEWAGIQVYNFM